MPRPFPSFASTVPLALCGVLALAGCGRSQAKVHTTTTTVSTAATGTAAETVSAPTGGERGPTGDPCPSIGTLAESRGLIGISGSTRMVRLAAVCSPGAMTEHLRKYADSTRFILVADELRAGVQPGALFELRFGPPSTGEEAVLGTLNFFAARRPGGPGQPHSVSYDVTRQVQAMAVSGWPARGLGVAIAPSGEVAPGSDASVGALRLVAQSPR